MTDTTSAGLLAMQYRFVLPADYDMALIERRIADKGPLLDNLPGLLFKAYLSARRGDPLTGAQDNEYAPFYVWRDAAGMHDFLAGPAFAALVQAFGRPVVSTWLVWQASLGEQVRSARYATRQMLPIAPGTDLARLREAESAAARQAVAQGGALAAVAAFEPGTWTMQRTRLWLAPPTPAPDGLSACYQLGHLSLPSFG